MGELIFREIVNKKGRDTYFLNDLKKKEVDSYCASVIARGMSADDEFRLKESDELSQKLAESISKTFYAGKMNHQNYLLVDKCLYEYKFDSIVVYKLFEKRNITLMPVKSRRQPNSGLTRDITPRTVLISL